ncbi:MAG: polysaccharide deacetylase family protein [Devosia sp.]
MRIINFHGVGQPRRELEPGEAPFWLDTDQFREVLDRIAEHPERQNLRITFDDSNDSDLEVALPELLVRDLTAQFFVLTGRLGQPGSLGEADVAALRTHGMGVGSHGTVHSDLTALSPAQLADELAQSRVTLEVICGAPVRSFAIPFGRYNRAVLQAIRQAGFTTAFSSDGGSASPKDFLQPRRSVRRDMELAEIDGVLDGRMPLRQRLRRGVAMQLKRMF